MLLTVARMHCMRWEAWWAKAGTGTLVNCIGGHPFVGFLILEQQKWNFNRISDRTKASQLNKGAKALGRVVQSWVKITQG